MSPYGGGMTRRTFRTIASLSIVVILGLVTAPAPAVAGAAAGQRAAHPVAVHNRQVAVEHDHVVGVFGRHPEPVGTGEGDVDGESVAAEAARKRLGELYDETDYPSADELDRKSTRLNSSH
mgnify:CR=1 FL=1